MQRDWCGYVDAVTCLHSLFLTNGDPLDARTNVERAWIGGREIDLSNRQSKLYDKYRQKYPATRDDD